MHTIRLILVLILCVLVPIHAQAGGLEPVVIPDDDYERIRQAQRLMWYLNCHDTAIDGKMGPRTREAVARCRLFSTIQEPEKFNDVLTEDFLADLKRTVKTGLLSSGLLRWSALSSSSQYVGISGSVSNTPHGRRNAELWAQQACVRNARAACIRLARKSRPQGVDTTFEYLWDAKERQSVIDGLVAAHVEKKVENCRAAAFDHGCQTISAMSVPSVGKYFWLGSLWCQSKEERGVYDAGESSEEGLRNWLFTMAESGKFDKDECSELVIVSPVEEHK